MIEAANTTRNDRGVLCPHSNATSRCGSHSASSPASRSATAFPAVFHAIGSAEIARVNLPVAVLIWLMIIPMLVKIDFAALGRVKEHWRGIGVTLFINWAVKPFSMALLGWLFIGWAVQAVPACRPDQQLHRRADPARRRAVHRHGVRVEQPLRRRAALHAEPGGAQRPHHGVRLRADRRAAARSVRDHGAVGDAAAVGRALHRRAGHHRPVRARARARRAEEALPSSISSGRCNRSRSSRC